MTKHRDPNHVHKLLLHRYRNGKEIYFCIDNCDYKISPELALGKEVICHRCGQNFRMNSYSITLKKPHCENCHIRKSDKRRIAADRRKANDRRDMMKQPSVAVASDLASSSIDSLRARLSGADADFITSPINEIEDEDL